MTEETKRCVRLLFECMDELREHDERNRHHEHYQTNTDLKRRLNEYVAEIGLKDPAEAARQLCTPE